MALQHATPSTTQLTARVSRGSTAPDRCRTATAGLVLGCALLALLAGYAAVGTPSRVSPLLAASLGSAVTLALFLAFARTRTGDDTSSPSAVGEGTRLGQYTLQEKIGEGGMGVVYKASHTLLRRPAAIKLIPPERAGAESVERFEREVQLTSLLTHPNTIGVYDFGRTDDGTCFYAMEYVEGLDLQTLVERHGPQSPSRVAHLLAQLAGALVEAHGLGLIHRDVKPANVMICERGGIPDVVKVLDFGLIHQFQQSDEGRRSDGRIVGTPLYLAPEALTAPESMDARSDLYAVGAVGYFLLTGVPPFRGKNLLEVCGHHLHSLPLAPSEQLGSPIPPELEALVLRCLAKSPDLRPASAAALQTALLALAAGWTDEDAVAWWAAREPRLSTTERFLLDPVHSSEVRSINRGVAA